jgi:hypothetical protein
LLLSSAVAPYGMEVTSNSITSNTPFIFSPPWKCVPKRKLRNLGTANPRPA